MTHAPLVDSSRTSSRPLIALAALALAIAIVARFSFLSEPFNNDAGLYAAMGKAVVEGRQLYVEIWDTKLPGITLLTAPLFAAFANHWAGWVTFEAAAGVVAAALLAWTVRRATHGDAFAFWATLACGLTILNFQRILISGFQLETPMCCLAIAAALAAVESNGAVSARRAIAWAFAAGLLAGAAATLKPTGLSVAAAAGLTSIASIVRGDRRPIGPLLAAAAGLAIAGGVNLWWFDHLRVWPYLADVWHEIALYGSGTPWAQVFAIKTAVIFAVFAWPLAIVFGATRGRPATRDHDARRLWTFALAWLAIEALGVIAQRRVYAYHFLPVGAPTTLIVGLLVARHRLSAWPVTIAIVPLLAISCLTSVAGWRATFGGHDRNAVIDYVRAHTAPGDFVFADPVGEFVVRADRRPGSRVGMLLDFANHDGAPQRFLREVTDDLDARRCTLVVLPLPEVLRGRIEGWAQQPVLSRNPQRLREYRAAWDALIDYVHTNYSLEQADLDGQQIWRRNDVPTTRP